MNNSIKSYLLLVEKEAESSLRFKYQVREEYFSFNEKGCRYSKGQLLSENEIQKEVFYPVFQDKEFFLYTNENISSSYYIRLVLHWPKDLFVGQASSKEKTAHFAQELLEFERYKKDFQKYPLIHLALTDVFIDALYGESKLSTFIPRSFQIMDNSIWNYLIPLFGIRYEDSQGKKIEITLQMQFYKAVESICKNYDKHLYSLQVAQEYADLNARLISESYLTGTHAIGVSPFIFHSESVIKRLIKDEFEAVENNVVDKITEKKWRFLLVDDKAYKAMEPQDAYPNDKDSEGLFWNCKARIIRDLILKYFYLKPEDVRVVETGTKLPSYERCKILIEYVENIEEAKKALKDKEYDVILLDYFLGNQEYGYELLDDIYYHNMDDKTKKDISSMKTIVNTLQGKFDKLKLANGDISNDDTIYKLLQDLCGNKNIASFINRYKDLRFLLRSDKDPYEKLVKLLQMLKMELESYRVGPCDRYFFMFISAYSSAVYERLLAEGLNQSEKYWHINVGACPTNTPQLFLYNLIKLMEKRIIDSGMSKLSSEGIIGVVEKIFPDSTESPRKLASKHFQEVQSLQYHYRSILEDYDISARNKSIFETSGSVLMTDFMINNINLGGLLEHFAQLVHLTAFGTIRQWPEMWEEYIYFKAQLESQIDKEDKKLKIRFSKLSKRIQNYISDLKSSSL